MFKFFDMISGFIETIVNSVVSAVRIVVYLFDMITSGLAYTVSCVAYMPAFISGFCIVVFSLALIWTVIQLIRG